MTDDSKKRAALITVAALQGVAEFPWDGMVITVRDHDGADREVRLNAVTVTAVWRRMCDEVIAFVAKQGGVNEG